MEQGLRQAIDMLYVSISAMDKNPATTPELEALCELAKYDPISAAKNDAEFYRSSREKDDG
jgi:hypothetical protein